MTFKNKIGAGISLGALSALSGCSGVDGSNATGGGSIVASLQQTPNGCRCRERRKAKLFNKFRQALDDLRQLSCGGRCVG
jgi:hypothetical protein